jgi:hypothetical protein
MLLGRRAAGIVTPCLPILLSAGAGGDYRPEQDLARRLSFPAWNPMDLMNTRQLSHPRRCRDC